MHEKSTRYHIVGEEGSSQDSNLGLLQLSNRYNARFFKLTCFASLIVLVLALLGAGATGYHIGKHAFQDVPYSPVKCKFVSIPQMS